MLQLLHFDEKGHQKERNLFLKENILWIDRKPIISKLTPSDFLIEKYLNEFGQDL